MWSRVYYIYIYIHIIWGFYQEHWVNTGEIADTYTDIYISWNNLIYPLYQAAHINYSDINSYWLIFNFVWINYHIYIYIVISTYCVQIVDTIHCSWCIVTFDIWSVLILTHYSSIISVYVNKYVCIHYIEI